jgi:hypothetical protein
MLRCGLAPLLALLLLGNAAPGQSPFLPPDKPKPGKKDVPKAASKESTYREIYRFVGSDHLLGGAAKKAPTTRDLLRWLEEPLDVRPFQTAMSLKEVLQKFTEAFAGKQKYLPFLVDVEAFMEDNPDAPDLYDTQVRLPPFPKNMTLEKALRFALSRIPTHNATFLVRRGCIEITTLERGAPAQLPKERVTANFEKKPLAETLEELADMTGATIILDPRVGEQARTPISARFRNTISLEGAVRLLAKMAGLRTELDEGYVLFVTSRAKEGGAEAKPDLRLRDRPLKLALLDLARWSRATIILDPRAENEDVHGLMIKIRGEIPVSGNFAVGTSAAAAARILAVMAGLETVPLDNAVFVTTRKVAEAMRGGAREDQSKKPAPPK